MAESPYRRSAELASIHGDIEPPGLPHGSQNFTIPLQSGIFDHRDNLEKTLLLFGRTP
jgi:hypothetical protein